MVKKSFSRDRNWALAMLYLVAAVDDVSADYRICVYVCVCVSLCAC